MIKSYMKSSDIAHKKREIQDLIIKSKYTNTWNPNELCISEILIFDRLTRIRDINTIKKIVEYRFVKRAILIDHLIRRYENKSDLFHLGRLLPDFIKFLKLTNEINTLFDTKIKIAIDIRNPSDHMLVQALGRYIRNKEHKSLTMNAKSIDDLKAIVFYHMLFSKEINVKWPEDDDFCNYLITTISNKEVQNSEKIINTFQKK